MLEKYWIKCPICNGKTRVQVFYNTVLRNFPLFCPKCKLTHIVKAKLFCPEIAGLFCRIAGLFCHDSRANLSLKPVCFGIAIS